MHACGPGPMPGDLHDLHALERSGPLTQLVRHGPMMTEPLSAVHWWMTADDGACVRRGLLTCVRSLPSCSTGRSRALGPGQLGVTDRQLEGARFVRIFPRVHRHAAHVMSARRLGGGRASRAPGARPPHRHLATPAARARLRAALADSLRRRAATCTWRRRASSCTAPFSSPRWTTVGVVVPAAFLAYCARARDDRRHQGRRLAPARVITRRSSAIRDLALAAPWRDGAHEAIWCPRPPRRPLPVVQGERDQGGPVVRRTPRRPRSTSPSMCARTSR